MAPDIKGPGAPRGSGTSSASLIALARDLPPHVPDLGGDSSPDRQSSSIKFLQGQGFPLQDLLFRGVRAPAFGRVTQFGTDYPGQPGLYAYEHFELPFNAIGFEEDAFRRDYLLLYDKSVFVRPSGGEEQDYWRFRLPDRIHDAYLFGLDLRNGEVHVPVHHRLAEDERAYANMVRGVVDLFERHPQGEQAEALHVFYEALRLVEGGEVLMGRFQDMEPEEAVQQLRQDPHRALLTSALWALHTGVDEGLDPIRARWLALLYGRRDLTRAAEIEFETQRGVSEFPIRIQREMVSRHGEGERRYPYDLVLEPLDRFMRVGHRGVIAERGGHPITFEIARRELAGSRDGFVARGTPRYSFVVGEEGRQGTGTFYVEPDALTIFSINTSTMDPGVGTIVLEWGLAQAMAQGVDSRTVFVTNDRIRRIYLESDLVNPETARMEACYWSQGPWENAFSSGGLTHLDDVGYLNRHFMADFLNIRIPFDPGQGQGRDSRMREVRQPRSVTRSVRSISGPEGRVIRRLRERAEGLRGR